MHDRYVLIAGQGRSGTNWLLDILDHSTVTHCRNEPDKPAGSALTALPTGWVARDPFPELEAGWDEAARRASRSFGERDHRIRVRKGHLAPAAQRLGLLRAVTGPKYRKVLGVGLPALHRAEWPIPWFVASAERLGRALPILKVNQQPGWMVWVLRHRPSARVLHIVRHPGGFLNSYTNRWLAHEDPEQVVQTDRRRLAMIAEADPAWASRFGAIEALGPDEAELWFWRYAAETIHEAGQAHPDRYQLIIYEDLIRDPVGVARSIYEGCGLPWDDAIEAAIRQSGVESGTIAGAWRGRLDADQTALLGRILDDSPLRSCWPEPVAAGEAGRC